MDRTIILLFTLFGVLTILWLLLLNHQTSEMGQHLGEQVVIDSDTTTIVDYSTWSSKYTLSNGTTISKEFLNK